MKALIFGGGKIARGFIAQLLKRSGYEITFVDINRTLMEALNERGRYYVNVMGNEKESQWITGFRCLNSCDIESIAAELLDAEVAFSSVGGKNLESLAETIARAFALTEHRWGDKEITLITCENWKNPARQLETYILERLKTPELKAELRSHIGVSEAAILRSGIEPTKEMLEVDPYTVSVTDYWELPVDKMRMRGTPVALRGLRYTDNFENFLQRKIYTFNTTNATIAYIGMLKGYVHLMDAANDAEICEIVDAVQEEMNRPIAEALGVTLQEQQEFAQKAQKKYKDRSVIDFLERHCRDPLRKLGPEDRIVGTARMIEREGGKVRYLALTLAAALYYQSPNEKDESAKELADLRQRQGIKGVLEQICKIRADEPLAQAVLEQADNLRRRGWLHE